MRYGLNFPNVGACSDPRTLADLAHEAEEAGWDGFFLWDTIHYNANDEATHDPWITLAAIAMRTERVRIGTMVTPLSRRRPWKLAREAVTLDHLSHGRLILGIGLGDLVDNGFARLGEEIDAKLRAQKLDEGLDVLAGLWSGRPFSYSGKHYQVQEMTFLPPPVQQPRIPIWVGGFLPNKGPMRRAAHWDGAYFGKLNDDGSYADMISADVLTLKAFIEGQRSSTVPFDIVVAGETPGDDPEKATAAITPLANAGATWWIESFGPWRGGLEAMRTRIKQGPPRVSLPGAS